MLLRDHSLRAKSDDDDYDDDEKKVIKSMSKYTYILIAKSFINKIINKYTEVIRNV